MSGWILSIAGIAVLLVLCDVILPDGQTKKYVKTVFGVVVSLVVVLPLTNLTGNMQVDFNTSGKIALQQQYLDSVNDRQAQQTIKQMQSTLTANGYRCEVRYCDKIYQIKLHQKFDLATDAKICKILDSSFAQCNYQLTWT